jgi:phosphatidylglycerophosphatase A
MDKLFMFVATGGFIGSLPGGQACWGAVAGLLLWLLLSGLSPAAYFFVLTLLFILGAAAAGAAEKIVDRPDPEPVVVDAMVGQLIGLALVPRQPLPAAAALALFCFFILNKPFPVAWIKDHLHGGLAIMLDDAAAGLYTMMIILSGSKLYGYLT